MRLNFFEKKFTAARMDCPFASMHIDAYVGAASVRIAKDWAKATMRRLESSIVARTATR
jgi:hypothetical protein